MAASENFASIAGIVGWREYADSALVWWRRQAQCLDLWGTIMISMGYRSIQREVYEGDPGYIFGQNLTKNTINFSRCEGEG